MRETGEECVDRRFGFWGRLNDRKKKYGDFELFFLSSQLATAILILINNRIEQQLAS